MSGITDLNPCVHTPPERNDRKRRPNRGDLSLTALISQTTLKTASLIPLRSRHLSPCSGILERNSKTGAMPGVPSMEPFTTETGIKTSLSVLDQSKSRLTTDNGHINELRQVIQTTPSEPNTRSLETS